MYCTTGLRKYAFCYFRCFKQPGRGPVMLTVPLSSEVYCQLYTHTIILVAMGECPQTCMIKARIAPRSGAPAMLHTFAPRPAAAALAALRCSVLMCAALTNRKRFGKMSANARASSAFASAFLAALIIMYACRCIAGGIWNKQFSGSYTGHNSRRQQS